MAEETKTTEVAAEKETAAKKPAAKKPAAKKTAQGAAEKKPAAKKTKAAETAEVPAEKKAPAKKAPAKKAEDKAAATLTITLTKSLIACKEKQIKTALSLGLKRPGNVTVQPDNTATRGKIASISHMVEVH